MLVVSLSIAALSIAACGGSSGSSGSGGAGGTTTTTDITLTGGSGGSGGTGGATQTGCIKCADWAMNGGSPDTICAGDAKTAYDALIKCVCTDQCKAECGSSSPCNPMGMANATCGNCEASKCGTEGTACLSH